MSITLSASAPKIERSEFDLHVTKTFAIIVRSSTFM